MGGGWAEVVGWWGVRHGVRGHRIKSMASGLSRLLVSVFLALTSALNCETEEQYAEVLNKAFAPLVNPFPKLFSQDSAEANALMTLMGLKTDEDTKLCNHLLTRLDEPAVTAEIIAGAVAERVEAEQHGHRTNYTMDDAEFLADAADYEVNCQSVACTTYRTLLASSASMQASLAPHASEMYRWLLTSKGGELPDGFERLQGKLVRVPLLAASLSRLADKLDAPLVVGALYAKAAFSVWEFYHSRMTEREMVGALSDSMYSAAGAIGGGWVGGMAGGEAGGSALGMLGRLVDSALDVPRDADSGEGTGEYFGRLAGRGIGVALGGWWGLKEGAKLGSYLSENVMERIDEVFGKYDTPEAKLIKAYRFLGVAPSAPNSEVSRVYRRLAREMHPDRHAHASEAEKQRLTERMAVLNVMLEIIREARSEEEGGLGGQRETPKEEL